MTVVRKGSKLGGHPALRRVKAFRPFQRSGDLVGLDLGTKTKQTKALLGAL